MQVFGDQDHDNRDRDGHHNRDRQRAEQAQRDALRARYQTQQRRAQCLRDYHNGR